VQLPQQPAQRGVDLHRRAGLVGGNLVPGGGDVAVRLDWFIGGGPDRREVLGGEPPGEPDRAAGSDHGFVGGGDQPDHHVTRREQDGGGVV